MRLILTFILLLVFCLSNGQDFSYPSINSKAQKLIDFVPDGWIIIDSVNGDLNNDRLADAVLVIQHKDSVTLIKSEDTVFTQPRILLILFKNNSDKRFHLIEKSNTFILTHDNSIMDDPYQGIKIYKGVLKIDFHLFYNRGGWYTTGSSYKFRYNNKEFQLIGADLSTIHRGTLEYEEYSYNFLANKRSYTKGDEIKGIKKTTWAQIEISNPMTFQTFKEPYSWEIESDIYL